MRELSTYAHVHATVQLDEGERFYVTESWQRSRTERVSRTVEVFEVRWSGLGFRGTGRHVRKDGSIGTKIATDVVMTPDEIPLPVRQALAVARRGVALQTLEECLQAAADLGVDEVATSS